MLFFCGTGTQTTCVFRKSNWAGHWRGKDRSSAEFTTVPPGNAWVICHQSMQHDPAKMTQKPFPVPPRDPSISPSKSARRKLPSASPRYQEGLRAIYVSFV